LRLDRPVCDRVFGDRPVHRFVQFTVDRVRRGRRIAGRHGAAVHGPIRLDRADTAGTHHHRDRTPASTPARAASREPGKDEDTARHALANTDKRSP